MPAHTTAGAPVRPIIPGSWTSSPTTIDSGDASSAAPLVVDAEGNVTSAWLENYGSGDDPQAGFFSATSKQWATQNTPVDGAGVSAPQLIVDQYGTTTMVWSEYHNQNANSYTLFASRSAKGGAWTTPVPINSTGGTSTNAQGPVSMVVDSAGNVTVAWLEQDLGSSHYAIGSARFTPDITASPTLYDFLDGVSPNANHNIQPKLVVDSLGYVTAVWQEQTGSGYAVQGARLDPSGSTWSTAANLNDATQNASSSIAPQMVVGADDYVTVVWQENSGSQKVVQAARIHLGKGGGTWTSYASIAPALSDAEDMVTPQIIADKNGSVTIAAVSASMEVWTASFASGGSSWSHPSQPVNTGTAFSVTPLSMVADQSGTVTLLWQNNNGGQLYVQTARGYGTAWSASTTLDTGNADGDTPLLLGIDGSGNVTAAWTESGAMQAARFSGSWSATATLDNNNQYNQIPPKMTIGPNGGVTIVWQEGPNTDGKYAIQAANFAPGASGWTSAVTLDGGTQAPHAYNSPMTQQLNMAVDSSDNVTVTWLESVGATIAVQSAYYTAPHY